MDFWLCYFFISYSKSIIILYVNMMAVNTVIPAAVSGTTALIIGIIVAIVLIRKRKSKGGKGIAKSKQGKHT